MAAFTAAIAVAGLAINFIGQRKQAKALKKAQRVQETEAGVQGEAIRENAKVQTVQQQKAVDNSKALEEERKKEAKLEADSKRRANVRSFLQARARSLSSAVNRGIGIGSSAIGGGLSSAASQFGSNARQIASTQQISDTVFGLNQRGADIRSVSNIANTAFQATVAESQARVSAAGSGRSPQGEAISSFGTSLFANAQTIGNVGTSLFA